MRQYRKYNIDAYRNLDDLRNKIDSRFSYDNLLLTCYDACILLLQDLCHNLPLSDRCYAPTTVTLETLVNMLVERNYSLEDTFACYDRLYHTYYLVYNQFLHANRNDVNAGLECLKNIWKYYVTVIPINNLFEIYTYSVSDHKDLDIECKDDPETRERLSRYLFMEDCYHIDY